jgi:hypothetical protein
LPDFWHFGGLPVRRPQKQGDFAKLESAGAPGQGPGLLADSRHTGQASCQFANRVGLARRVKPKSS